MKEYSYEERHMGTAVSLSFVCPNQITADTMAHSAFTIIKNYEQRFSRFLLTSELSQLNQAGTSIVSAEFLTVLKRSLEMATLTKNNFNPLLQVKLLGYTDSYSQLKTNPSKNILPYVSYNTDHTQCDIHEKTSRVTLKQNQQLDFGGILKGYLATEIADIVMDMNDTCTGCIINIGGDLATRGVDELHQPFIFHLYNPITGIELPIAITNKSLATSGTYAREWQTDDGIKNHIVDEHTHRNPKTDIVAVSIIADDGALTEALTKLFLTRGVNEAITIVSPHLYHYQYFVCLKSGETNSTITII